MSFILDALRKSEAERLRRDTPGFADVPDKKTVKSTAPWMWVVVALVVVNVGVLAVLLLKPQPAQQTVDAERSVEPAMSDAQAVAEPLPIEPPVVPVEPATLPAANPVELDTAGVAEAAIETFAPEPRAEPQTVSESFATFNDLKAQGVLQLPDLHLDIHVYSTRPDDRFVFVNMSKYKERATLVEGPLVREITPEGVILEFRSIPFLLPRE